MALSYADLIRWKNSQIVRCVAKRGRLMREMRGDKGIPLAEGRAGRPSKNIPPPSEKQAELLAEILQAENELDYEYSRTIEDKRIPWGKRPRWKAIPLSLDDE